MHLLYVCHAWELGCGSLHELLIHSALQDWNRKTQGPYRTYRGGNIALLRAFLDKEEARRQDAEQRCIPFKPRADDSMNLY